MHITQVEIDNFKSFARKTKIPFFEGYTVVSGPNGSGKSNIIDAILFVLALSSSRSLRAETMTDFINFTSGKNTAEVTLTFSDGTKIRRRIKQTASSAYSYYYLNEKTSSQTEILDYLAKNGIRPHGYNVVMQGDITRIMSMSDRERRGIIDEIAGVAAFDTKKEQALIELDQVRAKIEREELLLEGYVQQLKELSGAREDAVKYQNLNRELDYFNAARKIANIKHLETELSLIASSRADAEGRKAMLEESIRMEENERDARREEVADIDKKIAEKQGPAYLSIISGQEAEKGNIRVAEDTIKRRKKDKEQNLSKMNNLYMELVKYQNSYNDKNKEAQTLQIDRANLAMEVESQKKTLKEAQDLVSKKSRDSQGAQAELVELIAKTDEKKDIRGKIYTQRDGIIEASRVRRNELEKYEREQGTLAEERAEVMAEISRLESEIDSAREEKSLIVKQVVESERQMLHARKVMEGVRDEIARLSRRQMQLEAQQQASGASDRAISAVSGMDGVFGTVSALGKVLSAQHTVALNIAAGGRLNNVIVDNDQTGANAIRYLKEERLGRLTFLPLNKMKPQPPLPPLAGNGIIDYAINLIDFEPAYRDAFNLVFGQTVVVENLDAGRRLMGRYRMVTLEGELLDKGGSMTGGSINRNIRGFGVAVGHESAELSAKIAELREQEAELQATESRHRAVSEGLRDEKGNIESKITSLDIRLADCNKKIDKIAADEVNAARLLEETKRDATENADKVAALEKESEAISAEIEQLNARVAELRDVLNADEFDLLTKKLQSAQNSLRDAERRLETKTNALNDVALERRHFKQEIDNKTAERAELEASNAELDSEIMSCNQNIEAAKAELLRLDAELKAFSGELEELSCERARVQEEADQAQFRITSLNGDVERSIVQISVFDEKSAALAADIAEMRGSIEGEVECELPLEEIQDRIITTERAIKRLGNVNMLAIEQFDELEKKTRDKTEKKDTLSREREALLDKIESFRQMKHDAFMDSFNAINGNFQKIYERLNEGEGRLVLDDYEDPFKGGMTFEVSPRGKEVHRLNMMSGGEKSLTTLSFIFAVQQYMPAPFYALDEIDSNLDGLNVERLSQLVREICADTQFVIVSHRKPMIEAADRMMGVTVRPGDKSTLVTGVKMVE